MVKDPATPNPPGHPPASAGPDEHALAPPTTSFSPGGNTVEAAGAGHAITGQTFGDFEVLEEVGRGGMGIVYKARQKSLNRLVAFKILQAQQLRTSTAVDRFLAEARTVAQLRQPNIVTIYQVGECPAGHYIAMEYIDGQPLAALLRQRDIPIPWAVSLLIRISEAVHYAHGRGIIHRDLKPGNIMIEQARRPVVLDFGLAKALGTVSGLTEDGVVIGTPAFMAPEQASGGSASATPLSDVYSLGAVLYAVLTRHPPFRATTIAEVLAKVIADEPPLPVRHFRPDVPPELEAICMKCLSKHPEGRYPTGRALAQALRPLRAAFTAAGQASARGLEGSDDGPGDEEETPPPKGKRPGNKRRGKQAGWRQAAGGAGVGHDVPAARVPSVPLPAARAPLQTPPTRVVQFVVADGPDKGLLLLLPANESLLLGRSQAAEARLNDPDVARIHCQLEFDGEQVRVKDFDSGTGTFLNGSRVSQNPLQPNDLIQIGGTRLRYLGEGPGEPAGAPSGSAHFSVPDAPSFPSLTAPPAAPAARDPGSLLASDVLREIEQGAAPQHLKDLVDTRLNRYEVGSVIGRGPSGVVFLARDTKGGQPVALKVLHPETLHEGKHLTAFLQALKALKPTRHPNVVGLLNAGQTEAYVWLASELVEGLSLRGLLKRLGEGGRFDWRYAYRLALYVGQALDFAHGQGLVHGDVTPGNILVRTQGNLAKLGDLMTAAALRRAAAAAGLPAPERVGGLPFAAPEQTYSGAVPDARSDLYGLGACLYRALSGRAPFDAPNADELIEHIRRRPPWPLKKAIVGLPRPVDDLVLKLLAKEPDSRYQSAGELLADLDRLAKTLGLG